MTALILSTFRQCLMQALRGWRRRMADRRRERNDALQLGQMSEHELSDLGIGRSEVPALVHAHEPR